MSEKTTKINKSKLEAVESAKSYIGSGKDLIFTDFRGLNVGQITELRKRLREKDSDYRVVKNNYTKIAISDLGLPDVSEFLFGPTAIALSRDDVGPVAKAIFAFTKESSVKIKGGIVGGKVYDSGEIQALSAKPFSLPLITVIVLILFISPSLSLYCK